MRPPGVQLLALLVLAAAAFLAACGREDDEAAIRDTIRRTLTTTDPADCSAGDTTTAGFRRQYTFGSAALARQYEKLCRDDIQNLAAKAVRVSAVKVDGDRAQARFSATGGQYVFADATVALRKDDDRWQLDRFTAVKLERDAFDAQQVRLASGGLRGFSQKDAACFARRLKRVGDATLERAIVTSDPAVFADPLLVCFTRPALLRVGLGERRTRCVIRRLRGDPGELTRIALAATTKESEGKLQDLVVRAATACTS